MIVTMRPKLDGVTDWELRLVAAAVLNVFLKRAAETLLNLLPGAQVEPLCRATADLCESASLGSHRAELLGLKEDRRLRKDPCGVSPRRRCCRGRASRFDSFERFQAGGLLTSLAGGCRDIAMMQFEISPISS